MTTETATPSSTWQHWRPAETIEVDGLTTAYRRDGSGETLLFLHGAGLTRAWLPLYAEFAKRFDTVVPEHPGYGETPMPETLEGVDDIVLHYDSFIRELGLTGPIHLAGHSLGGLIAANLALTYPDRFASVTLLQPFGIRFPEAPAGDPFRWGPEDAVEALLNGHGERYVEFFTQGDDVERAVNEYQEGITFARLLWNPRYDHRLDHRLARISAPTTVVGFEDDRFVPVAQAKHWAELIPGSEFKMLTATDEPATHLSILQQPERLAELVAESAARA